MPESVNITSLARQYHATTPNIRRRLDRLGVKPLQEILMPSGRKFVLFDKDEAILVLDQEKRARERLQESLATVPSAAPTEASEGQIQALQQEVSQLKDLMRQMLDSMTTPHHN